MREDSQVDRIITLPWKEWITQKAAHELNEEKMEMGAAAVLQMLHGPRAKTTSNVQMSAYATLPLRAVYSEARKLKQVYVTEKVLAGAWRSHRASLSV